jgi:hypothetical protein
MICRFDQRAPHGAVARTGAVLGTLLACGALASCAVLAGQAFALEPATPPLAGTGAATEVTPTGATLTGTVQTAGPQTSYGVQTGAQAGAYGPDIVVGQQAGPGTQTIALHLSELQPGTTYHYRMYATNQSGTGYGADEAFTTPAYPDPLTRPPVPPLVASPPADFPGETRVVTGKAKPKPHKKAESKKRRRRRKRHSTHRSDRRI